MPISVSCTCGARLQVRDDAAGKKAKCPKCGAVLPVPAAAPDDGFRILEEEGTAPATAGPPSPSMKRCAYCGGRIPGPVEQCLHCGRALGQRPATDPGPNLPEEAASPGEPRVKPFPWEVLLVIVVIGIDMAIGAMNSSRMDSAFLAGALLADILMILGLVLRSTWGWWLSVVLLVIRTGLLATVLSKAGPRDDASFVIALLGGNALAVGLLILSTFRDSYSKN